MSAPIIQRQSQQHLAGVRRVLQVTTACPSCAPDGWSRTVETAWKEHYLADEKARLQAFARQYGEFMPESNIPLESFGSSRIRSGKVVLRPSMLDFWEPTRAPVREGDGLCAPNRVGRRDRTQSAGVAANWTG